MILLMKRSSGIVSGWEVHGREKNSERVVGELLGVVEAEGVGSVKGSGVSEDLDRESGGREFGVDVDSDVKVDLSSSGVNS